MGNIGIKVVREGADIKTAVGSEILLTTKDPLIKLDSTSQTSFRDIKLTFTRDPPEPTGVGTDITLSTIVYQYPHGYNYVPSFWGLVQNLFPSSSNFYQAYFQADGILSAHTADDNATLSITADATNIYFTVTKFYIAGVGASMNNIIGTILNCKVYVFVDDIGQ